MTRAHPKTLACLCVLLGACVPLDEEMTSATEASTTAETSSSTTSSSADDGATVGTSPAPSTSAAPTSAPTDTTDPTTSTTSGNDTDSDDTTGEDTDSTSEGEIDPICGDGVISGDEECDDGPANADNAACTSMCKLAYCGDGLTQTGKEACDKAEKNGDGSYGGCTDLCQLGPRCGDKELQPDDEDCDPLDPELEDGSRCVGCKWDANLIFASSAIYKGDLGGLDGADAECRALAKAVKLSNADTFRAWLSTQYESPTSRFQPPAGDFVLPNGALVATSWSELLNTTELGAALMVDESNTGIGAPLRVWSNTTPKGESLGGPDCAGWTSDYGTKGSYGKAESVDSTWTDAGDEWCAQQHRLYCVATAG